MGTEPGTNESKNPESLDRFRILFECSPNPILVFSDSGILDCNPAAVKILGATSKSNLLAQHPARFSPKFQPDGRTSEEKSVEMDGLARKNGLHRFEWIHKKFDGTDFPVEVTLAPIEWTEQRAVLVLWNDLTEKKNRERQIIQSSKLASLGELSAGIAHEINNPLAIIFGNVESLHKSPYNPLLFEKKFASIQRACDRISKIINGLRKFSRSTENVMMAPHSLNAIVNEALIITEPKTRMNNVTISTDFASECMIFCNEIEIEQVVLNLINNAIDAIQEIQDQWIKVSIKDKDHFVILKVLDSGEGIPEATKAKIFDPFFTTKAVGKGTGLGLSISKGILDLHHATIAVASNTKNTCFEVRFPKYEMNQGLSEIDVENE
jgi:PAS domain S-box-containing protein